MRRISIFLLFFICISCSSEQKVVTSDSVLPHCHCEGQGKYTIVMDAGMGNWSLFYLPVFEKLKKITRVCLIDRSGFNNDSISSNRRDSRTIALEMDKVLQGLGMNNNLILVGHSMGGLNIRMYQSLYREKVKGLILLDAAHPEQFKKLPNEFQSLMQKQVAELDEVIDIAEKGWLRYTRFMIPAFGIPDSLHGAYFSVVTSPSYYLTIKSEVLYFEESLRQVGELKNNLHELPLLVIASSHSMEEEILPVKVKDYPFEEHNKIWFELQQDLARLSQNSTLKVSRKNHYLNITDASFVAEEIGNFFNTHFHE